VCTVAQHHKPVAPGEVWLASSQRSSDTKTLHGLTLAPQGFKKRRLTFHNERFPKNEKHIIVMHTHNNQQTLGSSQLCVLSSNQNWKISCGAFVHGASN